MRDSWAILLLAALTATSPASAAVTYQFTALSSFPDTWVSDDIEAITGSFEFTVPSALAGPAIIPSASLTSCSMIGSISGPIACGNQEFLYGFFPDSLTVSFVGPTFGIYYYFDALAATNDGTWNSTLFGTDQQGILTTIGAGTGNPPGGVVPEPATWAMLIAGFGLTGAVMRRRRMVATA